MALIRDLLQLIRASRIYRTIPIITVILLSSSFAGEITTEVYILIICCIFSYSSFGIYNAKKDKDFILPSYSNLVIILLSLFSLALSFFDKLIFIAVMLWVILGYVYHNYSRRILYGDSTILSLTHFGIPSFISSMILNLDLALSVKISFYLIILSWFMVPSKNIKDTKKDKKRGYKTLTTDYKDGKSKTCLLIITAYLIVILSYILFNLSSLFLFVYIVVLLIWINALKKIKNKKSKESLNTLRLGFIFFISSIIFFKTNNPVILSISSFALISYILVLINDKFSLFILNQKNKSDI